ncbi:MAG: hypothetical protein FWG99_06775 [Treponema sp.]|nr:hypothetical protein [Treponema sp.]
MKIKYLNTICCKKCLHLSLPVDMMIRFAREVDPGYNIYRRTGLKEGMPIANQDAAERIVADMVEDGRYVDFVEKLIQIDTAGFMGRRYDLKGLKNVVANLVDEGYSFDKVSGQFFENHREQIRANWGRLNEGDERKMTLLRMDIAGNSALVKNNSISKVEQAYQDMRNIISRVVVNRHGRLWSWEGDGALAAFLFGEMEKMAVFAGMEIIHELFFYNRLHNPLNSPINLRLGAHIGHVRYSDSETERLKNETAKEAAILETLAANNALCISSNLYITMDQITGNLFSEEKFKLGRKHRLYKVGMEK